MQPGRAAPAAGPRASFIHGELEPVARIEHGFAAGPGAAGAVPRELVDDARLACVLAAEDHDVVSVEGGGATAAGCLGQPRQAGPGAFRLVEAVDARRRRRAAA